MKNFMIISLIVLSVFTANRSLAQAPPNFHNSTDWNVKPSLKYDALCLINILTGDTFLMDKVLNHDPKFGYNDFEAYIEENCVRALDQMVSEEIGLSEGAKDRFKNSDGGMHVFANALYQVMKEENFNNNEELFSDFLIRMISEGKFEQGSIKNYYDAIAP